MRNKIEKFIVNNPETCTLILCFVLAIGIIICLYELKEIGL